MEHLRAQLEFTGAAGDSDGKPAARRFRMRAYTGAAVLGGRVAFEVDGLEHKPRVPILLQHDEDRPIGFADQVERTAEGLILSGQLLDNANGREVAAMSDAGFPWEASIGLSDITWEHVEPGDEAELNGTAVTGPISIGRTARLVEVSFVTAGADKHTEAMALAAARKRNQKMNEHEAKLSEQAQQITTLAEERDAALAAAADLEAQLATAQADLEAFRAAQAEAEAQRREAHVAKQLEQLQAECVELQQPLPAGDLERVAAAYARGDDDTAVALAEAYASRAKAQAAAVGNVGQAVELGSRADAGDQIDLSAILAKVGVDPNNPRKIKV